MKRIVLIAVVLMMAASAAHSQSQGYLCLFSDDTRASYCAAPGGPPLLVNMQIWALPRFDGTFCAEFMVDYPEDPTVIAATVTPDPTFTIILGDLSTGVSACYGECKTGWIKLFTQLIICQNANKNMISIVNHPLSRAILFNECVGIRPKYPAVPWNSFYLNYVDGVDPECGFTAVDESSWGAIKRLMAD